MNEKTLVIIPFINVSNRLEDEYFSDGITDELLVTVNKINGIRTLSRTSSFHLKNKNLTVHEIGDALGVDYILEGSVRKLENLARITVQLIDIESDTVVMSELYEAELHNIFNVQSKIAAKISEQLKGVFDNTTQVEGISQNSDAFDLYLKGNYHWYRYTKEEIELATKYFNKAIKLEPEFALAHAGLAKAYTVLGALGFNKPESVFPKAKQAAKKALLINNRLVEPYLSSAWVSMFYDRNLESAKRQLAQAVKLNPNNATSYASYAKYYMLNGQLEKAEVEALRSIEIDPIVLTHHADLFRIYYFMGRYDDALKVCQTSLDLDNTFLPALEQKGWIYTFLGELDKALEVFMTHRTKSNNSIESLAGLSYAHARAGLVSESQDFLQQIRNQSKEYETGAIAYQVAVANIGLRNYEEAYANIKRAVDSQLGILGYELLCNPIFHQLKSEHMFTQLFREVILVDHLYPVELMEGHETPNVIYIYTNTKEKLLLDPNDLLFAEAENNYTKLFWQEGSKINTTLLRISLSQLEKQIISFRFIVRSHRSFLLNVKGAWTVKGNAKGYSFKSVLNPTIIPVSRSRSGEVLIRYKEFQSNKG
jgi:adenylate cyclase